MIQCKFIALGQDIESNSARYFFKKGTKVTTQEINGEFPSWYKLNNNELYFEKKEIICFEIEIQDYWDWEADR